MAKILIVDDSQTLRDDLRRVLVGAGHTVIEAENGVAGLTRIEEHGATINLILADINMPDMDGLTMCQKIRHQLSVQVPIIMLTTEASAELKARAKEIGVRAWVTKPYVAAKLLAGIDKLTTGSPSPGR